VHGKIAPDPKVRVSNVWGTAPPYTSDVESAKTFAARFRRQMPLDRCDLRVCGVERNRLPETVPSVFDLAPLACRRARSFQATRVPSAMKGVPGRPEQGLGICPRASQHSAVRRNASTTGGSRRTRDK